MKLNRHLGISLMLVVSLMAWLTVLSTRLRANTGSCGGVSVTVPFTDVSSSNMFFCSIAEAYFSGLTNGTTATTYSPSDPVPREQMAAFVTRTLDQSLKRGKRAALHQFWATTVTDAAVINQVNGVANLIKSDGTDVYMAIAGLNAVQRFRASSSQEELPVATYSGIAGAYGICVTPSLVYVTGRTSPGTLYSIPRGEASSAATLLASDLGDGPTGIAYDGAAYMDC
jgi:hypothetical protein